MKVKILLFYWRLTVAWQILTRSKAHWFIIGLSTEELEKYFKGELDEFNMTTHRLQAYDAKTIMRDIVNQMTEEDWILEKATFEGEAEWRNSRKSKLLK